MLASYSTDIIHGIALALILCCLVFLVGVVVSTALSVFYRVRDAVRRNQRKLWSWTRSGLAYLGAFVGLWALSFAVVVPLIFVTVYVADAIGVVGVVVFWSTLTLSLYLTYSRKELYEAVLDLADQEKQA